MTAMTTPSPEPDLSGCVLDRYRLLRCLGVGGMGAVYEAEHTTLGKHVAVKLLRQQHALHEIARKRFLQEARAATRVKHPNVVDVSDFGQTADGRIYFVMELLAGRDLRELLDTEGRLPWPRVRELLVQIVSALGSAHAEGIVHRDIKPSNCFLVDVPGLEGRDFVKVLDFGIAKLTGKHGEPTQGLTSTDEVFGTVGYMAPEMAIGISDDPRSDVYAVGVMMYRMLVGELPFDGGTAFQILARHVGEPPVPPRARVPSIPEGVERIILTALAKRPEQRFASMQALGDALGRGDVDPQALALSDATVRMDGASALERTPLERTASLTRGRFVGSGPWPALEPTDVLAPEDPRPSGSLTRTARVTASRPVVRAAVDDGELDAPEPEPELGEGKRRLWFLGAILMGMVVTLAAVAIVVALAPASQGTTTDPVAAVPPRAEPTVTPDPAAMSEPVARAPSGPPQILDRVAEPPEPPVDDPGPEPPAGHDGRAPTSPASVTPTDSGASKPRAPRTDAAVVARLAHKLRARCRVDGRTTVSIEGIIATSGRVLSPLVSPSQGPGACARKLVTAASFAPGPGMRPMPVITVAL